MTWLSDAALAHLRDVLAVTSYVTDEPAPDSAPRYVLRGLLGRGGMGVVHLAFDRVLGREVALKLLDWPERADLAERLEREAQVLARLEHPGIVPVYDAGRLPDGRRYYAMKRVQGQRLDAWTRGAPELAERLRIFLRLCDALAFAHAHGVLHRDLKPENVMVGAFGELLVLDWGVAHVSASSAAEAQAPAGVAALPGTRHGTVLGTPGYMSPEQARGDVASLDARSDVFALGALLGFLLTGRAPGAVDRVAVEQASTRTWDTAATTKAASATDWSLPGHAHIARPLAAIVRRAMAEQPDERYPSVQALAADVARYQAGERVDAHAEGPLERLTRLLNRHRTLVQLVAAYVLLRGLLLLWPR